MIEADSLFTIWLLLAGIGLYFLPTILAFNRDVLNKWSVAVINVLLGWTLIGWAVALAMSVRTATAKTAG